MPRKGVNADSTPAITEANRVPRKTARNDEFLSTLHISVKTVESENLDTGSDCLR